MKRLIVFLIPFCIVLTLDGVGFGDRVNLTELKKKEEERRKKVKKSQYKLTNGNLNSIKVPQKKYAFVQMYTPTGSLAQEEDKVDAAPPDAKKKEDPQKSREYWTDLTAKLEDEIAELGPAIERDQIELNGLVARHLSMDLPLQKTALKDQIDQKAGEIARKKSRLTDLQRELNRLPERARKAGVPSGWVR